MAREKQTREIGGLEYTVVPLGTERSLEVLQQLGKILGPSLGEIGAAINGLKMQSTKVGGDLSKIDIDLGKIGAAFGQLFFNLAPKQLTAAARDGLFLRTTVLVDGKRLELCSPKAYDEHFAGDLPLLFKVLMFSAEVQYGNFSEALKDALSGLGAHSPAAEAPSTSPST